MEMITPSLKLKTNELFFKWFTEADRNDQLKELIHLIKTNKVTKVADLQTCFKDNLFLNNNSRSGGGGGGMRPKSPTIQSPPMSPVNHRMPSSPKSPRKKLQSMALMNNIGQLVDSEQQPINRQLNKQQNKISLFSSDSPLNKDQQPIEANNLKDKQQLIKTNNNESLTETSNKKQTSNNNEELQLNDKKLNSKNAKSSKLPLDLSKTNSDLLKSINQNLKSAVQKQQTLQKIEVPQFYFPYGKPEDRKDDQEIFKLASTEFNLHKETKVYKEDFENIVKAVGLPKYWKMLLFRACVGLSKLDYVTYSMFEQLWKKVSSTCFNRASLFFKLLAPNNATYLLYEDWEPIIQDIVDTHPGLKFLHDHKEFHSRYIKTVIARIYYYVNRSWSGKITVTELKQSNFLSILETLETEDDINLIKDYFSYEHFYVIYCKFWELDKDHDLFISKEDLYRHNNYAISQRVIDRIFSGTVISGKDWRDGLMSYYDFVWFLISEEDKRNQTSIEYWFRVLDIDGDGVLSMYELEYFYNEQIELMKDRQIEFMPFNDLLCQILDLVKPSAEGKIRLKDLKKCKLTNVFFDTFINLEKYLEYEQRDPFANVRDNDAPEPSDWERYASEEYENLISEDVNGDNQDYNNYDDDFEDEPILFNNNSNKNFQHQIDSLGLMTSNTNIANLTNNNLSGDLTSNSNSNNSNNNRNTNNKSPTTSAFVTNRSNFNDER